MSWPVARAGSAYVCGAGSTRTLTKIYICLPVYNVSYSFCRFSQIYSTCNLTAAVEGAREGRASAACVIALALRRRQVKQSAELA